MIFGLVSPKSLPCFKVTHAYYGLHLAFEGSDGALFSTQALAIGFQVR